MADPIVVPAAGATAVVNRAEFGVESAGPATAEAKPRRSLFARKGAIAVVLVAGVAAAFIMVLNWPQGSHPQAVEPGMLADQPTKVMAPSAALATVPPREGQMSPASGRKCMRPGETRSRRSCRSRGSRRPHPRRRRLRPQPLPRSADLSPWRNRQSRRRRRRRPSRPSRARGPRELPPSRHPLRLQPLSRRSPLRLHKGLRRLVLAKRRRSSRALARWRRR